MIKVETFYITPCSLSTRIQTKGVLGVNGGFNHQVNCQLRFLRCLNCVVIIVKCPCDRACRTLMATRGTDALCGI